MFTGIKVAASNKYSDVWVKLIEVSVRALFKY